MSSKPTNPAITQIAKAASGASASVFVPVSKAPGSTISCSLVDGALGSAFSELSVATETGGCRVSWANSGRNAQDKAPVTLRVTSGAIYTDTDFILEISNAAPGSPPTTVVTSNGQTVAQGTTLTFAVGNPYTVTFTSTDPDAGALITAQLVGVLPSGATLTNVGPAGSPLVSTFTWTPTTPNQLGTVQLLVSDETNKQDKAGNIGTASFTVTITDTTKPDVTVPSDITAEADTLGGRVVTFSSSSADITDADTTKPDVTVPSDITAEADTLGGRVVNYTPLPSATDINDGAITPSCSVASGSKFAVGSTTVTCTAKDKAGNIGTASFTVTITDTTKPDVTVPSDITAEADTLGGRVVTFSSSSADITDADTTKPDVTVPSDITAEADTLGGRVVTFSSSSADITDADTTKPDVTVPSDITAEADTLGGRVVTFSSSSADITDADTTKPDVTVPSDITAEADTLGGRVVTFSSSSADITDADTTKPDVTVPSDITAEADTLGGRVVTFSSSSADITDADVTPPTFPNGPPADITLEALSAAGAPATITAPAAADTEDAAPAVVCERKDDGKALTDLFPLGATVVTCTATDRNNNAASVTFMVTVAACAFGGFRPPVENPAQVNLVSTQQNLPLKWSMGGYWGMNIFAPGYPRLVAVNCGTFADPDVPTDVPTDATVTNALKYDTTEGRYMLGYSLKGRTVINTCYQLQLQFTTCPGRTFLALVQAVRNK
ncbi:hypothetical protein HYH03_014191 [Edaphochlamys debaryana]|uniref:HYR domain-containing protein n=1 Tax=Edaphochlamys debaryana TaxID=47281 RepID=A0A835XNB3_9CHLO|nr:hypothetical protein HYH03_014191 [Edaphochlamys debaryana]KAG2487218.1 hypothetical protein HYH03_014191 [Edaphochlamys debaryana]|eukprot:KAG2487217.1 hypothetical protein HYH03_014191 [Edaphochlamys debaryana]